MKIYTVTLDRLQDIVDYIKEHKTLRPEFRTVVLNQEDEIYLRILIKKQK